MTYYWGKEEKSRNVTQKNRGYLSNTWEGLKFTGNTDEVAQTMFLRVVPPPPPPKKKNHESTSHKIFIFTLIFSFVVMLSWPSTMKSKGLS